MIAIEKETRQLIAEFSLEFPVRSFPDEDVDIFNSFRSQNRDRFGGGTPHPAIPASQRAYDGENWLEYCESIR